MSRRLRYSLVGVGLALLLFVLSPYWTLWRLHQVMVHGNPEDLAALVELNQLRDQVRHRLNKDATSDIGAVSQAFIDWLEQGLRDHGTELLEPQVSLDWVYHTLRRFGDTETSFLRRVRFAFYHRRGFLVRIEHPEHPPAMLLLQPTPLAWRVVAMGY